MYVVIDDRDVGQVDDNAVVIIGEGEDEIRVMVTLTSVHIESKNYVKTITLLTGNDAPERTLAEVLDAFDRAIAGCS